MLNSSYKIYATITGRKFFIKFNKFLFQLSLRGLGIYNYQNMKISGEEYFIKNYILPKSKEKERFIVFDVGANKGEYSKLIHSSINNCEILAFEPHPNTYKNLENNLKELRNIKLYNCGLSSTNSKMKLYDYNNNDGSAHASLNNQIFKEVYGSNTISHEIEVFTLDKIIKEYNIKFLDFLKIDVEGFELEVLKGSINLINNKQIGIIQFEFTQLNSTTRVLFKDFYKLLSSNYNIYRLLPNGLLKIKEYNPTTNEIFAYQNFVAIIKK